MPYSSTFLLTSSQYIYYLLIPLTVGNALSVNYLFIIILLVTKFTLFCLKRNTGHYFQRLIKLLLICYLFRKKIVIIFRILIT